LDFRHSKTGIRNDELIRAPKGDLAAARLSLYRPFAVLQQEYALCAKPLNDGIFPVGRFISSHGYSFRPDQPDSTLKE